MWGIRPPLSSSRRSRHVAIPPILPICRSSTARSGAFLRTDSRTSAPRVSSRTAIDASGSADRTSARTRAESLTMSTSGMCRRVAPSMLG